MTTPQIVAATEAHAPALAAIHARSFPPGEVWGKDAIAIQVSLPGAFGLADAHGGGMVLARVAADEAEILTLATVPEARRQGVGRALLAAAMAEAAARGATSVVLEVAVGNAAALALYDRAGFVPVGRRVRYYPGGGDALVLRAPLSPGVTLSPSAQAAS